MTEDDSFPWIIKVTDVQERVQILDRFPRGVVGHSATDLPNPVPEFLTSYDHDTSIPSSPASGLSDGMRSLHIGGSQHYPSVSIDPSLSSLSSSHRPGLELAQASDTGTVTGSYLFRRPPPPVNTSILRSFTSSLAYSPHSSVSSSSPILYSSPTSPSSDFNPVSSFESFSPSISLGPPFYGTQPGFSAASESSTSSPLWASPSGLMHGLPYFDTDQQLEPDCQEIGGLTASTFPVSPASATSSSDYFTSTSRSPSSSLLFSDANVYNSGPSFHAATLPIARDNHYGYPQSLESSQCWIGQSLELFESSDDRCSLKFSAAQALSSDSGSPIMVQSSPSHAFTSSNQNALAYALDSGVLASSSSSDLGTSPNWRGEVATEAVAEAAIKRRRRDKPNRKLFNCPHCPRNFTASQNLRYHIFSHEGTRNFHCIDCDRDFTTPHVLKRHRRKGCPRRRRSRSL